MHSPKKWGTAPPSVLNDFGHAFSHLVGRKHSDMVARPLPGGGVIIDRVTSDGNPGTEILPSDPPMLNSRDRSRSTFTFAHSVDSEVVEALNERVSSDLLSVEENEIEKVVNIPVVYLNNNLVSFL